MAEFYSARGSEIPPLPWTNLSPPFSDLASGVVADYQSELPSATACFMDDFKACIAHLRMPITHRRAIRTTNLLERLFVEERRRLQIIPNAFGGSPCLSPCSAP